MSVFFLGEDGMDFVAVSAASQSGGSVAFSFTADMVGAFAVVFAQNGPSVVPTLSVGSGWATDDPGDYLPNGSTHYVRRIFSKVLTAGDISSGVTVATLSGGATDAGAVCYVARGPTSMFIRSNTDGAVASTTLTLPGFALAANSLGVVALIVDRDLTPAWSAPAAPITQTRLAPTAYGGFQYGAHEWAPGDFTGANMTFSGFANTNVQNGIVLEFTK
jgi:hypothetical protein